MPRPQGRISVPLRGPFQNLWLAPPSFIYRIPPSPWAVGVVVLDSIGWNVWLMSGGFISRPDSSSRCFLRQEILIHIISHKQSVQMAAGHWNIQKCKKKKRKKCTCKVCKTVLKGVAIAVAKASWCSNWLTCTFNFIKALRLFWKLK